MLLKKYDPLWIEDFEAIKSILSLELQGFDLAIEHVGSTSIPKLDSKPIIDIDIILYKFEDFEKVKVALQKLGYYHNGNQGVPDREVFKKTSLIKPNLLNKITHHLYVCPYYSKALERHILMRDFLRKNEWARNKYQEMKYEVAERANQDKKLYAALKEEIVNDFIDMIIEQEKISRNQQ
jgi:GrpB-like predicted nucleotidyltransferase (UPF0157 family)